MRLTILIHVTHLLGVGHLTRAMALARAFAAAGHRAIVASGGMPAPLIDRGGAELVQLPPLRSDGLNFSRLLDEHGAAADDALFAARAALLAQTVRTARPDMLFTELYPFGRRGLRREIGPLIDLVRATGGTGLAKPLVLSSVRDILVVPADRRKVDAAHAVLASYDGVLVHTDPTVVPLEASWPLEPSLRPKLHDTGYLGETAGAPVMPPTPEDRNLILVSGGGGPAALPLFRAALAAAALVTAQRWRLLVGHGVTEADMAALAAAAPGNATIERARPDFPALLAHAAVSISQAGYNTMLDLARAGTRAIVVPFEQGNETEQRQRADLFAARGWLRVLPEAELSGSALADAVRRTLAGPKPPIGTLDIGGARRSVAIVEALAAVAAGGAP